MGVRLKDVAERAGVSMKTVSNVVHGYTHVSPAMRTKVQSAIDELGYVPNMTARRLVTGRTGTIALAVPGLAVPYFAELAAAFSDIAAERDYRVLIEQTAAGIDAERQVLSGRARGVVDGVVFQPTLLGSREIATLAKDMPLVLLGEADPPRAIDHVMIDNFAAAVIATSHLIGMGRRRIAFLGHERGYRSNTLSRRLLGYQSAIEHHGLPKGAELRIPAKDFGTAAGAEAVAEALEAGIEFDGLVCYDDLNAIGALHALRRAGRQVPGDVAVVGWDDITLARYLQPPLTTIVADRDALVRRAVDMLLDRIDGQAGPGRHELVPFHLAIRESTARGDLQR